MCVCVNVGMVSMYSCAYAIYVHIYMCVYERAHTSISETSSLGIRPKCDKEAVAFSEWNVRPRIHTYVHTHTHTYTHTYTHTHIYTYTHTRTHGQPTSHTHTLTHKKKKKKTHTHTLLCSLRRVPVVNSTFFDFVPVCACFT